MKIVVVKVKMPQFAIFTESEFWPHFDQKEHFADNGAHDHFCGQHQELLLENSLMSLW